VIKILLKKERGMGEAIAIFIFFIGKNTLLKRDYFMQNDMK